MDDVLDRIRKMVERCVKKYPADELREMAIQLAELADDLHREADEKRE